MVDLAGLPSELVTLLKAATTGEHIASVELVGLKLGDGRPLEVYDLTLNDVTVAGYAADGDDTALAFNYAKVTETIRGQKPDGTLDQGQTFTYDVGKGGSIAPVNQDELAALIESDEGAPLTYLLKIDGVTGNSTIDGYVGWFTVDEYTFGVLSHSAPAPAPKPGRCSSIR